MSRHDPLLDNAGVGEITIEPMLMLTPATAMKTTTTRSSTGIGRYSKIISTTTGGQGSM